MVVSSEHFIIELEACGYAVMDEQGVQEGVEYAPLWGPCVEDQLSGGFVSFLHHLGAARQEV